MHLLVHLTWPCMCVSLVAWNTMFTLDCLVGCNLHMYIYLHVCIHALLPLVLSPAYCLNLFFLYLLVLCWFLAPAYVHVLCCTWVVSLHLFLLAWLVLGTVWLSFCPCTCMYMLTTWFDCTLVYTHTHVYICIYVFWPWYAPSCTLVEPEMPGCNTFCICWFSLCVTWTCVPCACVYASLCYLFVAFELFKLEFPKCVAFYNCCNSTHSCVCIYIHVCVLRWHILWDKSEFKNDGEQPKFRGKQTIKHTHTRFVLKIFFFFNFIAWLFIWQV